MVGLSDYFRRASYFYRNNGFLKSIKRLLQILFQQLFKNKTIIYYVLAEEITIKSVSLGNVEVRKVLNKQQLPLDVLNQLSQIKNIKVVLPEWERRWEQGAVLWVIYCDGYFVGYNWSIREKPVAGAFYFPTTTNDFHIFDQEIFKAYRGKGINSRITSYILNVLKTEENMKTSYLCVKEWNDMNIRSIAKTEFHRMGLAYIRRGKRRSIVKWYDSCE